MLAFMVASFAFLLIAGVPIVAVILTTATFPVVFDMGAMVTLPTVIRGTIAGADSTVILAVPLFVFAGTVMSFSGIAQRIFNVFTYFIGNLPGGMPCAVIITCLFYGAISGSGPATVAAVGMMTVPLLVSLNYDKTFVASIVGASGGLGIIIPPSVTFVLYGQATGTSVGDLFMAGILPGCLISLCMIVYVIIRCKIVGEDRATISAHYRLIKDRGLIFLIKDSFWAMLSPVVILGGIYSGIVTPTEAACISVFYSLIIALFIYRTLKFNEVLGLMRKAVRSFAPISILLASATALSRSLTLLRIPVKISDFVLANFDNPWAIIIFVTIILVMIGMVMDCTPAILILSPILLPVLVKYGVSPVYFGTIMICCVAIGQISPPFGSNLFVASQLIESSVLSVGKKAYPLILCFLVALSLIIAFPRISLFFVG